MQRIIVHSLPEMDMALAGLLERSKRGEIRDVTIAGWAGSIVITWWSV